MKKSLPSPPKRGKGRLCLYFYLVCSSSGWGRLKNLVPFFEIFSGDIKDIAASSLIALFQPLPDFFQRTFYIMNLEFSAQFFRFRPECIPFFSCPESIVKDDVDPTRQYFLTGFPHQLFHNSMTLIVYLVRPVSVKIVAKQFQMHSSGVNRIAWYTFSSRMASVVLPLPGSPTIRCRVANCHSSPKSAQIKTTARKNYRRLPSADIKITELFCVVFSAQFSEDFFPRPLWNSPSAAFPPARPVSWTEYRSNF